MVWDQSRVIAQGERTDLGYAAASGSLDQRSRCCRCVRGKRWREQDENVWNEENVRVCVSLCVCLCVCNTRARACLFMCVRHSVTYGAGKDKSFVAPGCPTPTHPHTDPLLTSGDPTEWQTNGWSCSFLCHDCTSTGKTNALHMIIWLFKDKWCESVCTTCWVSPVIRQLSHCSNSRKSSITAVVADFTSCLFTRQKRWNCFYAHNIAKQQKGVRLLDATAMKFDWNPMSPLVFIPKCLFLFSYSRKKGSLYLVVNKG